MNRASAQPCHYAAALAVACFEVAREPTTG